MDYLKIIIEFLITFILLYVIYYFAITKKCKKNNNYVPAEVNLILVLHKIDYKKIDLYKMIKVTSFVTIVVLSLIISIISNFFDSEILVIVFGTIISILLSIICYNYIGMYFKKNEKKR